MENEKSLNGPSTLVKEHDVNHQVLFEKLEAIEKRLINIEETLAKPLIDGNE